MNFVVLFLQPNEPVTNNQLANNQLTNNLLVKNQPANDLCDQRFSALLRISIELGHLLRCAVIK